MKRINMSKYGFIRWAEEDFSDDGNRFTCYRAGDRVRVSKLVADGEAYIDARIDGAKLPYEVYSKLPHYKDLGALNGVSCSSITDRDLLDLYEACISYEQEYIAAENNIKMPTLDDITEQYYKVRLKRLNEFTEIEQLITENLTSIMINAGKFELTEIKSYFTSLYKAAYNNTLEETANKMVGTARSISFCKPDCTELNNSWYYEKLITMINKII